jgi:hypothetical protein
MHWLEFILHWDSVVEKIRARRFFSKSPKEFEALKYQDTYIPFTKRLPKGRNADTGRRERVNHKSINYPPTDPPDYDY